MSTHHDHSHHNHDHGHGHHHVIPEQFNKAFLISILANFILTAVQISSAYIAHSTSLLADGAHNLGDVLVLILAWMASLMLKKRSSSNYSYGFKKMTIWASLINALILVFACALIVEQAISHLLSPHTVLSTYVMIIALLGILVNGGTALLFTKGQDDLNIKSAFLHLAYDALISLGVFIAGAIIYFTHWYWVDPIVGLTIGIFIMWGSIKLLKQSVNLAMDGVPHNVNLEEVQHYLLELPGVTEVHDLHIWSLSTRENALTAHLIMPKEPCTDEMRKKINHNLKEQFNIHHATIQVEQGAGELDCEHHNC
ncbi:MAG: cation diffusion facilitator family transporter [Gammaproteobacteria bacterium]|nr:cation diffusion facilitator family transporter [Gammaproteobacteria bacterium]